MIIVSIVLVLYTINYHMSTLFSWKFLAIFPLNIHSNNMVSPCVIVIGCDCLSAFVDDFDDVSEDVSDKEEV